MKLFRIVVVGLVAVALLGGCSKSKKSEEAKSTTQTQTAGAKSDTAGAEQTVQVAKINKTVEALPDVAQKFRELGEKPQPQDQQQAVNDMMMAMDEVAKKHGLSDGQELLAYMDFIVQLSSMQKTMNNLDSILNAMPPDQRNSPQVQQSVQQLKDNYNAIKQKYGDSVLVAVEKNTNKIDKFLDDLDKIRQEQAAKQQEKFQNVKQKAQKTQQQSTAGTQKKKVRTKK